LIALLLWPLALARPTLTAPVPSLNVRELAAVRALLEPKTTDAPPIEKGSVLPGVPVRRAGVNPITFQALPRVWACIAHYESTDSTTAINASSGDAGAFQISQHMWDAYKSPTMPWWTPSATLAQQLSVAQTIQRAWGWSQWETAPLCGV